MSNMNNSLFEPVQLIYNPKARSGSKSSVVYVSEVYQIVNESPNTGFLTVPLINQRPKLINK